MMKERFKNLYRDQESELLFISGLCYVVILISLIMKTCERWM